MTPEETKVIIVGGLLAAVAGLVLALVGMALDIQRLDVERPLQRRADVMLMNDALERDSWGPYVVRLGAWASFVGATYGFVLWQI